jgi:hypothetical protein
LSAAGSWQICTLCLCFPHTMWILKNWESLPLTMNVPSGVPCRSRSTSFPLSILYQDCSSVFFIPRGSGVCTGFDVTPGVDITTDVGITDGIDNSFLGCTGVDVTPGVGVITYVGVTSGVDVTASVDITAGIGVTAVG